MHLRSVLFLLSYSRLSVSSGSVDDGTNYLRKLKKDKAWKDDQGLISTEVLKTFDMSENRLGFSDWMGFVNTTTEYESNEFETSDEEYEESIDLDIELAATVVEISDSEENDDLIDDTVQPSPAPDESVEFGLDGIVPDSSTSGVILRSPAPVSSPNEGNFDSAQEEEAWHHGATAVSARKSGTITFKIPDTTHVGDTLFLFLSRTDGVLPINLPNWTRGAECFKTFNRQKSCMRAVHCIERDGPYCRSFERDGQIGNGKDLATVVFYRHVEEEDPCEWTLNLAGGTTTWAIVVSVPNVNREQPIQRVAGTSCDRKKESIFPSVYAEQGNVVLLSQSFDDTAMLGQFQPPQGTQLMGWTNELDEAGFVYGKKLDKSGLTGPMQTQGIGGPLCKDALLSVIVNID